MSEISIERMRLGLNLLCFEIGIMMDFFQIYGILHFETESLKKAVRYSLALSPRCFSVTLLSLSGTNVLLLLQLLILCVQLGCDAAFSRVARKISFLDFLLISFPIARHEVNVGLV